MGGNVRKNYREKRKKHFFSLSTSSLSPRLPPPTKNNNNNNNQVMTIYGLRSTMMGALALQATATAAFIPMRHAHQSFGTSQELNPHKPDMSIAAATAYATVVQILNGLARVLVRLGTRTLPRLVTPDLKKAASKNSAGRSERGLMWKSAMVNGGRTFVRGGGFFIG